MLYRCNPRPGFCIFASNSIIMKSILTTLFLALTISTSFAQSDSFMNLKEKFSDQEDVFSFGTSGFFARTILWMAGEHEFTEAIKEVKSIRLITIPKTAFENESVTVNGFKKVLLKDSFEELANVKEDGDDVTIYLQSTKSKTNRYMILVEEKDEVVAIEIRGYIDPNLLVKNKELSFND